MSNKHQVVAIFCALMIPMGFVWVATQDLRYVLDFGTFLCAYWVAFEVLTDE